MGVASAMGLAPELLAANLNQATGNSGVPPEYLLAEGSAYLNTGTLGPTPRVVLDRVIQTWQDLESNPTFTVYGDSPVHPLPDRVRQQAADFVGCSADELMITRSTTDAMNNIAQGMLLNRGDRVLTTDQEHEGGTDCWHYVARRRGIIVDTVRITPTDLDPTALVQRFADAITRDTKVVSVSHVFCTTGLRMPVTEIAKLAKDRNILFVVDGAQAVGAIDVNVKAIGCDAYAASGHKWLLGPKGTGLLYVKKEAQESIAPIQWQEGHNYIAGATGVGSIPLVAGLGAAIELAQARGLARIEAHNLALRNRAYTALAEIPKVKIMSAPPGPLATALLGIAIPDSFDPRKFTVSLREKYNLTVRTATKSWYNGIRIGPHIFNTEDDIDRVIHALRTELA